MKIIHVLESIHPKTGGPVKCVSSLATAQALLGHEVTLLCYAAPGHDDHVALLRDVLPHCERLHIIGIEISSLLERLLARSARHAFSEMFSAADVVHIHGVWKPFNIVAVSVAKDLKRKIVIQPHGMLDPWSLQQAAWKKKMAMMLVWRGLLNAATFLLALNDDEAALLAPLNLKCKVKIFPNGVFPAEFSELPDGVLFREHAGIGNRSYILFLSRLHYKKGLDYLIDSFELFCRENNSVDLVIAGPDDGMHTAVEQWVKARSLSSRVHMVGPLNGRVKMSALNGAYCFCLPSRQEGFSMAINESLACGVPVVISEQCHFPEVANANAGLVVPLESQAISKALLRLAYDQQFREQASRAARELVFSNYDWQVIARNIIAGYMQ